MSEAHDSLTKLLGEAALRITEGAQHQFADVPFENAVIITIREGGQLVEVTTAGDKAGEMDYIHALISQALRNLLFAERQRNQVARAEIEQKKKLIIAN